MVYVRFIVVVSCNSGTKVTLNWLYVIAGQSLVLVDFNVEWYC